MLFQDGTEYDEYGNRKKAQYGLGSTRPRGYDRSDRYPQESEPRPVYNYQKPSRTVDNDLKAVSTNKINFDSCKIGTLQSLLRNRQ